MTTRTIIRALRGLALPAALAAALPSPVFAQVAGGDLGIDCESPRRTSGGRLVLGDDGAHRAICEADRATALTYAGAVRETRDRLRAALLQLPPPAWDDLVAHLRTDDGVAGWTWADAGFMARLRALSAAATAPTVPGQAVTADRAHGVAARWAGGILAGSGVGADWRPRLRARACGAGAAGAPPPGAVVLVWLDPAAVRDRWTPRMVQRTALAWLERTTGGRFAAVDHVPGVVTAGARLLGPDGRTRDVSGDAAALACLSTVPQGALAMRLTLRRPVERGDRLARCADPDQVGFRRLAWARQNGVFVVPEEAVLAGGGARPDRGAPLLGQGPDLPLATAVADAEFPVRDTCRAPRVLDAVRAFPCDAQINGRPVQGTHVRRFRFREVQADPSDPFRIDMAPVGPGNGELGVIAPAGAPHPVWEEVTLFCEGALPPSDAPVVPPRAEVPDGDPDWTVPDCAAQWPGRFERGTRTGYRQSFDYPDGWPVTDEEIRTIDDDCFRPVAASGRVSRPGPACPAGHVGATVQARDLGWWNRDWAVPSRHAGGTEGDRTAAQASAAWDADPSQAGLDWWDAVTLVRDWRTVSNTCRPPPPPESDSDSDSSSSSWSRPDSPRGGDHPTRDDGSRSRSQGITASHTWP